MMIMDTLVKKMEFLGTIDRHFKIEAGFFFGCICANAERRHQAVVLRCLPSVEKWLSVGEFLCALDLLARGKLLEFCGAALQSSFTCVRDMVAGLSDKRCPKLIDGTSNRFLANVKLALAQFCTHTPSGPSGSAMPVVLYGQAASNAKYERLTEELVGPGFQMTYMRSVASLGRGSHECRQVDRRLDDPDR
jgi:hypothetical protein